MSVLILGAGPAGLAAAEAASRHGGAVTLIDENPLPGGQIWRGGPGAWTDRRALALWQTLQQRPAVHLLSGTRVVAAGGPNNLLLEGAQGSLSLNWQRLIVCSGARELLLPFPGWTLPGVTGAGGLQALIKGGGCVNGRRVLIAGTGPLLLAVAATVLRAGGQVAGLVEYQPRARLLRFLAALALGHWGKLALAGGLLTELAGVPLWQGASVVSAEGQGRVQRVQVRRGQQTHSIDCDFLAAGYGLVPNTELAAMLGLDIDGGRVRVDAQQASSRAGVWVAGEGTGIGGVDKALAEGEIAGLAATGQAISARARRTRAQALSFGTLLARSFPPPPCMRETCRPSTIVCRCEDVTAGELAVHTSWRSAKLQTRAGMGPCQGRICGTACQHLFGWEAPGLRQPIFPTNAATLAQAAREDRDS